MICISGRSPLSNAGFGGGVVGPAGRDGAGVCACASTDEATAVAPTTLAAFSKPRLVTVEALSRFDITSFQPAAWVKITTTRMSRVTKCVSTPPLLRFWRLLPKERFTAYANRAFLATVVSPNPGRGYASNAHRRG